MFIIDFRNKNMSEYRFSVINNSNVDVVNLYSNFVQYATNTSIYLKIRSVDDTYVDKIAIASENISIDDGALLCKWRMGAVSTHCKKIGLQLQFEQEGDIIAQTGIVYLTLADTIDVDELIPIIYPQILKELQEQIDALTNDSGAKVTLGYSNDVFTINLLNVNNEVIDTKTIAIPTNKAFVNVAFANRVITFTANDGSTKQVDLSDIYTKEEVNNLLANKVDKVSQANKVYATDGNGDQTALPVDDLYSGNIARRDANNQINVPATPTENGHATSKSYVDNLISGIKMDSYKVVDTTTYPTLNDFLASTGEEGYLYLYPIDTSDLTKGYYRYVWEGNAWLSLGTTEIDLSGYYTKNASIIPTDNGTLDIGSSSHKFKDLYLNGTAYIKDGSIGYNSALGLVFNKSLAPNFMTNLSLGKTAYPWYKLYLEDSINLNGGTIKYNTSKTSFEFYANLTGGQSFSLGDSSTPWKDLYLNDAIYGGFANGKINFYVGSTCCYCMESEAFRPYTNNAYDLGTSSYTWKDLYLSGNIDISNSNSGYNYYFRVAYNELYIGTKDSGGARTDKYRFTLTAFVPNGNNNLDLGNSSLKWKDAYINGTLYGSVYNFTIDSAYKIIYNRQRNDNTLTEITYEFVNICSKSADTTFTFTTPRVDTLPEYKAIITNSHQTNAITLTFTGVTSILCNDDNCVVNANTITIPSGVTIEVSVINGKMVAINFNA